MLRKANPAKAAKTQKGAKAAKVAKKVQKRSFSASPTYDPRFSRIDADLNRKHQTMQMPGTRMRKLPNGLRVASEYQPGGLVTVGVFVDAGSRYETDENNGSAHFLEHILFKGTSKRNRTQLELEIENMGGSLNAFTSREQTVFTATVQKRHTKQAVELLGDIIQNSKLTEQSIENERDVIIEEMNSVSQDLQETIYDNMHTAAFRHTSLAHNILGPLANIQKISKKDIDQYIKTHYIAPRVAVIGVGDIEHEDFHEAVHANFKDMPEESSNGIRATKYGGSKYGPAFTGGSYVVRDDDMPKVHLGIGFETTGWNSEKHYPLMVLQMMLGNSNATRAHTDQYASSDLVANTATWGLADSITPFNTIYSDTGIFGLYAVANCNQIDILATDMIRGLVHHATHVPEQSLIEARNKLKLSLASQYEGTEATCQELGRQLLSHGRRITLEESYMRIDNVDQSAVQNTVKDFFVDQDFVVSAVGNTFELQDYALLRKKSYLPWM